MVTHALNQIGFVYLDLRVTSPAVTAFHPTRKSTANVRSVIYVGMTQRMLVPCQIGFVFLFLESLVLSSVDRAWKGSRKTTLEYVSQEVLVRSVKTQALVRAKTVFVKVSPMEDFNVDHVW